MSAVERGEPSDEQYSLSLISRWVKTQQSNPGEQPNLPELTAKFLEGLRKLEIWQSTKENTRDGLPNQNLILEDLHIRHLDFEFWPLQHQVRIPNGSLVHLRPKESAIFHLLIANPGRIISHRAFAQFVWQYEILDTQFAPLLRVNISILRKKIGDELIARHGQGSSNLYRWINIRAGRGYVFSEK